MTGNSFGTVFRITTYGESHGKGIGVTIDGVPAGLEIDLDFVQHELSRRRPGQSAIVTQRSEADVPQIMSGVFEGRATGTPLHIFIPNKDQRSKDYSHIATKFRPSHADYTYQAKYGLRDYRGGGRSSARETAARVAAGAIAKLMLKDYGVTATAYVSQVGEIKVPVDKVDLSVIEDNVVRCANLDYASKMRDLISKIKKEGDTIGGAISCVVSGVPVGLGAPVFDKLHADLAKAMLSINAVKGFEYGSGFNAVTMRGSEHNDRFVQSEEGKVSTKTNYSGGIQGGISNGMPIDFRVAFKPVATIISDQESIDQEGNSTIVQGKGRHDPCVVPRAVPIVEAMAALVVADHLLRSKMVKHSVIES